MSYASVAAHNAPPEEDQPHPSQDLLDGHFEGETETHLPDVDHKISVVEQDWTKHPETSTSLGENTSTAPPPGLHPAPTSDDPSTSSVAPTPAPKPHKADIDNIEQSLADKSEREKEKADLKAKAQKDADKVKKGAEDVKDDVQKKGQQAKDDIEKKGQQAKASAKELSDKASKEGKKFADQASKDAEYAKKEAKEYADNLEKKGKVYADKAREEARALGKKAREELDQAETALSRYYSKSKEVVLQPGVMGGILGVVNIGILSTIGYFAYTKKDQKWDGKIVGGIIAGTLGLFGAEGVLAEQHLQTPEGQAEAQRAKEEGSRVWLQTKETVLRPGVAGGLVGGLNVAILTALGYASYTHWDRPTWDRRIVGGITAGLVGLSGLEGILGQYYRDHELPKQKKKGNF